MSSFSCVSLQVATSLPKSSNFKLVDVWLLFCTVSTFLIIIFHIVIDLLLDAGRRQTVLVTERRPRVHTALDGPAGTHPALAGPHGGPLTKSLCSDLMNKLPKRREDGANVVFHRRSLGTKRPRFQVSVLGMEKFARVFVAAVFFIFNTIYWLKAYTMD